VGGLVFDVIGADLEEQQTTAAAVEVFYSAPWDGGGSLAFRLTSSRGDTYDEAVSRQLSKPFGMTRNDTLIRGWRAVSIGIDAGRWTNQLVIVDAPGSLVIAAANASIVDGRQVNPLNDPATLLAVLAENLRPYPE
jgi:hypothetical protein